MKGDPHVWQRIRAERGEVADGRHACVFSVIGLDPLVLEPRDVDEAGEIMTHRIDAVSAPAPSCGGGHSPSNGRAFFRTPYGWGVARAEEIVGPSAAP